jgi:hypothetical protein
MELVIDMMANNRRAKKKMVSPNPINCFFLNVTAPAFFQIYVS